MAKKQKTIDSICELVQIDKDSFQLIYKREGDPEVDWENRIIYIEETNDWRKIYQFSHEALHLSFFDHNNQIHVPELNWIEEVVCEAFSIYCLTKYADDERINWCGYLWADFYKVNCKVDAKEIRNLYHLNEELAGHKSYEVLQYIHPYVLDIVNILSWSTNQLHAFLNYTKFTNNNTIVENRNVKITMVLKDLQEKQQMECFSRMLHLEKKDF